MALALGTDAFSVAVVLGIHQYSIMQIFNISFVIGLFHIFMPLIGVYGGNFVKKILENNFTIFHGTGVFDYIGAGMLILLGGYMVVESRLHDVDDQFNFVLKGAGLLFLGLSVSFDSLSVGISLGILNFSIIIVLIFGIVAAFMMGSGLYIGSKLGPWCGKRAQLIGGFALIVLGFRFSGIFL